MNTALILGIVNSILTIIGLLIAIMQLTRILRSVTISQQGNSVNVIVNYVNRYEKVMSEIPKSNNESKVDNWYYRYWSLYTEEFYFFRNSILDPVIFELWMNELATTYQSAPMGKIKKNKAESHCEYLDNKVPHMKALHAFFDRIYTISQEKSSETRATLVHDLITEFAPEKGWLLGLFSAKRRFSGNMPIL